jgi:hypothetical protein
MGDRRNFWKTKVPHQISWNKSWIRPQIKQGPMASSTPHYATPEAQEARRQMLLRQFGLLTDKAAP